LFVNDKLFIVKYNYNINVRDSGIISVHDKISRENFSQMTQNYHADFHRNKTIKEIICVNQRIFSANICEKYFCRVPSGIMKGIC